MVFLEYVLRSTSLQGRLGDHNVVHTGESEVQVSNSELVGAVVLKEEACPSPADLLM
jgi:hypothetical protein